MHITPRVHDRATDTEEHVIAWLDDAYAMETELLAALCDCAVAVHAVAEARSRIDEHIDETKGHVERLRQALGSLGRSPSKAGQMIAPLSRIAMSVAPSNCSGGAVHDVVVSYAAEQFEVASYTALIAAAEHVGEAQIARLCRLNRSEDEDMAEWLEARIAILIPHVFARGQQP
jgi:ferritin-like metal-binding protein YciE